MADPELVSVVMPVRNGGRWLQAAVDSILEQTHAKLELLLVDDGSTDGAVEALDRGDSRLHILPCDGRGVSAAFNSGLAAAGGAFVARMDADDVALPGRLEAQLALLASRPEIDLAGGCVEIFSGQPVRAGNRRYQAWLNGLREPQDIRREIFVESPIPNPTALFRREALAALGGYADPDCPEDYDLFLRADRQGMRMAKPEPVVLRWRDHGRRLTRSEQRYSRRNFQRAKAHFLLAAGRAEGELLLWGAGPTGRDLHDLLLEEGAQVAGFVDVHPRRLGGSKRGLPVWPVERAGAWRRGTVLVAVGARGARGQIRRFMAQHGREEGCDYLFVA